MKPDYIQLAREWLREMKNKHPLYADAYEGSVVTDFARHLSTLETPKDEKPVECASEYTEHSKCGYAWKLHHQSGPEVFCPFSPTQPTPQKEIERDRWDKFTPEERSIIYELLNSHLNLVSTIAVGTGKRVAPYLEVLEALEHEMEG